MTNPFKKKHEIDYRSHVRNHSLCMQLCLEYINKMAEESIEKQANVDLSQKLLKYQTPAMGQAFSGASWVRWFINDLVPEILEKETQDVSER